MKKLLKNVASLQIKNTNFFVKTSEDYLVQTLFMNWGKPGHFYDILSKGPKVTTWIWNLHADAHDFDIYTSSIEDVSRRIFSAHFGQLAIIFLWISQAFFHGARFSNYSTWLANPTTVNPSAQVVWPTVGQEILNTAVVSDEYMGITITSGIFHMWRAAGIIRESELYCSAIASLGMAFVMLFAGWFHYHKAAPRLEWFQNVESMLNHHLAGLLGLGCLSWSGHIIHVSSPINSLLDSGIPPAIIPRPQYLLFNQSAMASMFPSFQKGLIPFFILNWSEYSDILTWRGGLDPQTGSLWLTDMAHHHLALSIIFIFAGHMYRTNWKIGHRIKDILNAHKGPLTGDGHHGLYEILTNSWHAQLAINLAMLGSLSIIVAHHMYAMPPYPYIAVDYPTQLSLFVHHTWIGGFCICGAGAHAAIFMVRDYNPTYAYNNVLDRMLRHRDAIISHLNWVCIFLGTHSFGLYMHNDTMQALDRTSDTFSDNALKLEPVFANWLQKIVIEGIAEYTRMKPSDNIVGIVTPPNFFVFGGDTVSINGKVAITQIPLETGDFLVHHIHAFTIHVTVLILLKGVLFARNSRLIPDKWEESFRFPCDGPGRGGTCQVSPWDHVFLGLFWMYNSISIIIFHFNWKMQNSVWGTISENGISNLIINFNDESISVNGWLYEYLWMQSVQVIISYGTSAAAYGLIFLGAHFIWAFSLMFLFSGRGYWQELIESIVWAHSKIGLNPVIEPRALSITSGRAVGLAHFLLGGIGTTWAFFLGRLTALS